MNWRGRSWRNIESSKEEEIKSYLLECGGEKQAVKSPAEKWRVRLSDATFTYYTSDALYSTPSNSKDPCVFDAWAHIDKLVGSPYAPPTKDYLIGFDETGKGEIIGHMILTGAIFPKEIFKEIEMEVGSADTKKRHDFKYWDDIFKRLDRFRSKGFHFVCEEIPPWQVDKYNVNKIMDVTYQRILNIFFRKAQIDRCRIVLDDYKIGPTLKRFLNFLKKQGAEVIVTHNADRTYLEVKTASLVSKRNREAKVKSINENPEFLIGGLSIGSGNAADPQTIKWLKEWHKSGKPWPWPIKRSFRTVREIEGKLEEPKKLAPPIREDILSEEFLREFNKGHLSIQSLSLICPGCGATLRSVTFATFDKGGHKASELKCPNCGRFIKDAGFTMRYYCGYVIPDSSAVQRNLISNDLAASRFFESFTVVLPPVVRKECDGTPRGRREFEELGRYNAMGRIRLECPGKIEDVPSDFSSDVRDEKIIEACLENNAILLTADKSMNAFAGGKNVFTIFI
jgi:ribonuclease HII